MAQHAAIDKYLLVMRENLETGGELRSRWGFTIEHYVAWLIMGPGMSIYIDKSVADIGEKASSQLEGHCWPLWG